MQDSIKKSLFVNALLVTTLAPLLALPAMAVASFPFNQSMLLGLAIFAGGVGHVASTACIYSDQSVRAIMQPMKCRFFVLPIAGIVITGIALLWGSAFSVAQTFIAGIFIFHLFWLHFHYQKQNYGLIAFVAASEENRAPRILSHLLLLPALAGVLAIMPALTQAAMEDESWLEHQQNGLYTAALVVYILGGILLATVVFKHRNAFSKPRTMIFTLASFFFFLPAVTLAHSDYAFWSYALAHGFQYLLMVFTVSRATGKAIKSILAFTVSFIGGGFILHRLAGNQALFVCGILLTWIHFILDAKIWRMSEPGPRKLLKGKFDFLFHS